MNSNSTSSYGPTQGLRCGASLLLGLFAAFFLTLAPPALAQSSTGDVSGRVQNQATGRYLGNARVTVEGTDRVAFTDEFGEFRLTGLPAGPVTLRVFYTGLDPASTSVTVEPGRIARQDFQLTSEARYGLSDDVVRLGEFVVASRETDANAIAINEQRFAANLKNVVASDAFGDVTEGNIGEFIKYLPGVSVDYVAADVRTIAVRGFQDTFTPVTVDGNRMASAASSSASRSFELEQVSINNVARIEVVKVPTPNMGADSLGGAVNLVSKNAFERDRREIRYRAYTSISDENITLSKTPGPANRNTHKIRPGFDLSYAEAFNNRFGIVANFLRSDQFNEQHRSRNRWEHSGSGGSPSNPYLRRYELQDGPKQTERMSMGLNADWKVGESTVLSAGAQWNYYDSFFGNRNMTRHIGSNPVAFDGTFAQGRVGAGEVVHATSFRNKFGETTHLNLNLKHFGRMWDIDGGVFFSQATNRYRDTENGHFSNIGTRARQLTIGFDEIAPYQPGVINITTNTGQPFDDTDLSNYRIRSARSQPFDSEDEFRGAHVNIKRQFDGFATPFYLQTGVSFRNQQRDIKRYQFDWTYLGPDGVAESPDDNAFQILDTNYVNMDPHFGFPAPQWPSPYRLYDLFVSNPEYFQLNEVQAITNNTQNDFFVEESVGAAYLMGEVKLMNNRLNILGGFRFEHTKVEGVGFLFDPNAIYQRDANGNFVLDGGGNRIPITNDPVERTRLQWQTRAQSASRSYDGIYPSIHFVYNIREDLTARFSYAQTLGRPDFSEIIPGTQIDENENPDATLPGRIIARNAGLKPWQADNFDLSLEYYLRPAGVVSVGLFHKDISNFFGSLSTIITPAIAAEYNLDPQYVGWELQTKLNTGKATVQGIEFNYVQQLDFLSEWARGFSIFANGTFLHLEGDNAADFRNFIKQTGNWGFSWARNPVDVKVKWNYRGRQQLNPQAFADDAFEWYEPRTYLDVNFEWRFNRRLTAFINARNILNHAQDRGVYGSVTPDYARAERREEFAVQYAIGIKGVF